MVDPNDIYDNLPNHPTTNFRIIFVLALSTVVVLDPILFWSNEIQLSLSNDNYTITWLEEPWMAIFTFFQRIPNCTEGADSPPGKCIFLLTFYTLAVIAFISGIVIFPLVSFILFPAIASIDRSVSDKAHRERIKLAIRRFANIFPFKEPSIVYSLRNLIDYIIIVGIFFPQFRPSRFRLLSLTIVFTQIGQCFSLPPLPSAPKCSWAFLINSVFLALIYPLSYSHVVNSNSVCFAIEAYIKTRLLTKFCMYWFVRFVQFLPLNNAKFEQSLIRIKSENFNLDDVVFFFETYKNLREFKRLRSRDRIFLFDELLITLYILVLVCIEPQFGDEMHILLIISCAFLITFYVCRGVLGTRIHKEETFIDSSLETERKYILVRNPFGAVTCLIIFAFGISISPRFNCFAFYFVVFFISMFVGRLCQIIERHKFPRRLAVADLLASGIFVAVCFALHTLVPRFDRFFFQRYHSSFYFLILVSLISHMAMGFVTITTVSIARSIYKHTKKLSHQYCFHFENLGYLLVKEFSWRDPEQISNNPGYQCDVDGFYDRNYLETMRYPLSDIVYISNRLNMDIQGENIMKCVSDYLKKYVSDCSLATEIQRDRSKATRIKISEGNESIKNHFNELCKILRVGAAFANEESEHWIISAKMAQIADEDQMKKIEADYEAVKNSLQKLKGMLKLLNQQASFLDHQSNYKPGQQIEATLIETQAKVDGVYNTFVILARQQRICCRPGGEGNQDHEPMENSSMPIAREAYGAV